MNYHSIEILSVDIISIIRMEPDNFSAMNTAIY